MSKTQMAERPECSNARAPPATTANPLQISSHYRAMRLILLHVTPLQPMDAMHTSGFLEPPPNQPPNQPPLPCAGSAVGLTVPRVSACSPEVPAAAGEGMGRPPRGAPAHKSHP